ncbi:MAG: N-acetyltransferase family protein [Bdellovibrionales bacterium]
MIRRLTEVDVKAYYQVRLDMLAQHPEAFLTTLEEERARGSDPYREMLEKSASHAIFAELENGSPERIKGVVGLSLQAQTQIQHKAYVWGLFVYSGERRQGIGRRLLEICADHAQHEMAACGLYLSVESTLEPAKHLFESFGFKIWGHEPQALSRDGQFFSEDHMCFLFEN